MKKSLLFAFSTLVAGSAIAQPVTLAAQALACGGYVSLISEAGKGSAVVIQKVGQSNCLTVQIQSFGIQQNLTQATTVVNLGQGQIGSVLPIVVNDQAVLLMIQNGAVAQTNSVDQQRLALEAQRTKILQDQADAEKTKNAVAGAAIVVGTGALAAAATADVVAGAEH